MPDETIPCPRCLGPADLRPPAPNEGFPRSLCAAGHDHSLTPAVLGHLRLLRDKAEERTA